MAVDSLVDIVLAEYLAEVEAYAGEGALVAIAVATALGLAPVLELEGRGLDYLGREGSP